MTTTRDEPLVLLHGYPFDHTLWFGVVAALGAGIRVILPDLPGFGYEPAPEDQKPSMDAYADFLARMLDTQGVEKVIVAGMSMGGYAALAFAEKYPTRLAGLGLISSQSAPDTEEAKKARAAMIKRIETEGAGVAAVALAPKMFSDKNATNPDLTRFVFEGAERAGKNGLKYALAAMASRPNRSQVLKNLNVPVGVAHGTEDKIITLAQGRAMAENCRNPVFSEVKGAGHATPLEGPDAVAALLARLILKVRQEQSNKPEETSGQGGIQAGPKS